MLRIKTTSQHLVASKMATFIVYFRDACSMHSSLDRPVYGLLLCRSHLGVAVSRGDDELLQQVQCRHCILINPHLRQTGTLTIVSIFAIRDSHQYNIVRQALSS